MVYASYVTVDGVALWGDARGIKPYVKVALQDGVRYWHRKFIRRHFTPSARGRYGYKQRSTKYLKRKNKRGKPDLVLTGTTRDSTQTHIRVTGTAKQASGRMVAPWYVKMVPKKRNAPAMGDEIARTIPQEVSEVSAFMAHEFARRVANDKSRRTVAI